MGFCCSEPTVSSRSSVLTVKVLLEDSFDEARSLVVLDLLTEGGRTRAGFEVFLKVLDGVQGESLWGGNPARATTLISESERQGNRQSSGQLSSKGSFCDPATSISGLPQRPLCRLSLLL